MAITNTAPPAAAPIIIQGGSSTKYSEIALYKFNNNNNKLFVSNLDWFKIIFDWPHLLTDLHNILTMGRFFSEVFNDNVNL